MFLVVTDVGTQKRVAVCADANSSIEEIREQVNQQGHTSVLHHGGRLLVIAQPFDYIVDEATSTLAMLNAPLPADPEPTLHFDLDGNLVNADGLYVDEAGNPSTVPVRAPLEGVQIHKAADAGSMPARAENSSSDLQHVLGARAVAATINPRQK
jgi:hypothetical protein